MGRRRRRRHRGSEMVGTRKTKVLRYGLYRANLDSVRGSEITKTHPVMAVSPDAMNQPIETVVVCPLTSLLYPQWASRVARDCAGQASEVAVDQIRTLSKARLGKSLGKIDALTAAEVRAVIRLLYAHD